MKFHHSGSWHQDLISEIQSATFYTIDFALSRANDPFVSNKQVNNSQLTIVWNIDDIMVRHVDMKVINDFTGYERFLYYDMQKTNSGSAPA